MRSPKIKRYDKSRPSPIRYDKKVRWTWCDETGDKILLHLGVMRQERKKNCRNCIQNNTETEGSVLVSFNYHLKTIYFKRICSRDIRSHLL